MMKVGLIDSPLSLKVLKHFHLFYQELSIFFGSRLNLLYKYLKKKMLLGTYHQGFQNERNWFLLGISLHQNKVLHILMPEQYAFLMTSMYKHKNKQKHSKRIFTSDKNQEGNCISMQLEYSLLEIDNIYALYR